MGVLGARGPRKAMVVAGWVWRASAHGHGLGEHEEARDEGEELPRHVVEHVAARLGAEGEEVDDEGGGADDEHDEVDGESVHALERAEGGGAEHAHQAENAARREGSLRGRRDGEPSLGGARLAALRRFARRRRRGEGPADVLAAALLASALAGARRHHVHPVVVGGVEQREGGEAGGDARHAHAPSKRDESVLEVLCQKHVGWVAGDEGHGPCAERERTPGHQMPR